MPDEPSNGELGRLIQSVKGDLRDDIQQINARLDQMVSRDVYAVEKAAQTKEIRDLEKSVEDLQTQREKDVERVTQTRHWFIAAVVIPLLGIAIPLFMAMRGAG